MSAGPLLSVVVTGYRRPAHLRRTIESFLRVNSYPNLELILADDGSPPEMQADMQQLPFDRFLLPDVNRGLGANTNAGLRAARGDFILQLQDDWLCEGSGGFVEAALEVMTERPEIGLVRLCSRDPELLYSTWTSKGGHAVRIYTSPPANRNHFVYTDNPHIKSRAFVDFMGPYLESRYMQNTEVDIRDRFNAQTRFKAAFIEGYHCFEHIGEDMSFNRPTPRARLSATLASVPVLRSLLHLYRRFKQKLGH